MALGIIGSLFHWWWEDGAGNGQVVLGGLKKRSIAPILMHQTDNFPTLIYDDELWVVTKGEITLDIALLEDDQHRNSAWICILIHARSKFQVLLFQN